MKITFLGTSHGVPSDSRYCTSTMIEIGETIYLIDAGAPVVDLLLRLGKKIENIRAVFTTHKHGDHINGLLSLCDLSNWYYRNASFSVTLTDSRVAERLAAVIEITSSAPLNTERIKFVTADENYRYQDENIKITYLPTNHVNSEHGRSYAILVECDGKKVLFTGDLSGELKSEDFPKIASEEKLDLIICEFAHFAFKHIAPYIASCKTDRFLFTHVWPLSKLDEMNARAGEFSCQLSAPSDGDVIEL